MERDYEISRLKAPLTFKNYKAYDLNDDLANCVDLIDRVEFYLEVEDNCLSDSEVLQHAPKSKAASKIRLDNGFGDIHDILNLNPSIPWILGLYYVLLIYLFLPYLYYLNKTFMFIFLILLVIPLYYLAYKFNLNRYIEKYLKSSNNPKLDSKVEDSKIGSKKESKENNIKNLNQNNKTLKEYKKQFKDLTKIYDEKEKLVRKVIKRRFAPPQLTYNKFIASVDNCHELFYKEVDNAYAIIELNKSNLKVIEELENKKKLLNLIMKQIDDLSDELIITLGSESNEELEEVLDDMKNLIKSIKDYD